MTLVKDLMQKEVATLGAADHLDVAGDIMGLERIRHLPVLDGEKVVGVISIGDLVKYVIDCQSAAIAHLESYIHGGYGA